MAQTGAGGGKQSQLSNAGCPPQAKIFFSSCEQPIAGKRRDSAFKQSRLPPSTTSPDWSKLDGGLCPRYVWYGHDRQLPPHFLLTRTVGGQSRNTSPFGKPTWTHLIEDTPLLVRSRESKGRTWELLKIGNRLANMDGWVLWDEWLNRLMPMVLMYM